MTAPVGDIPTLALNAIRDGYPYRVEADLVVVENPDFKPDNGSDPNLVFALASQAPAAGAREAVERAEVEWEYREDDVHPPRDFWHARIWFCGLTSEWLRVGEQEERELPAALKEATERKLRDRLQTALSHLAPSGGAPAAGGGWRSDVENAPKTPNLQSPVSDFLAWCPDPQAMGGGERRVVWWEPEQKCWSCDADFSPEFTLWMPLPSKPGEAAPPPASAQVEDMRAALKELLAHWQTFQRSDQNQADAYYALAKNARTSWFKAQELVLASADAASTGGAK